MSYYFQIPQLKSFQIICSWLNFCNLSLGLTQSLFYLQDFSFQSLIFYWFGIMSSVIPDVLYPILLTTITRWCYFKENGFMQISVMAKINIFAFFGTAACSHSDAFLQHRSHLQQTCSSLQLKPGNAE